MENISVLDCRSRALPSHQGGKEKGEGKKQPQTKQNEETK